MVPNARMLFINSLPRCRFVGASGGPSSSPAVFRFGGVVDSPQETQSNTGDMTE